MVHKIHYLEQHASIRQLSRPKQRPQTVFKDVLRDVQSIHISKHAQKRMIDRNIHLTKAQWQQVESKMKEAMQKGVTDSLILTSDAALLASTTNKTIVTALRRDEAQSKIFTNINGTILIE